MLPACNKGVGMNIGFPDVCLTPAGPVPVPIPYPNMAMHAMAAPFCPTILLTMMPALNMGSVVPLTLGDQPGVANPLFMQAGMFTMGNPTILLQGLPAVSLTSPTSGNMMNNPVGAVLVPSVTNVFFACAAPPSAVELPPIPPVESALLDDGTGYLAIHVFAANVPALVYDAVRRLTARGMTLLILDLRGNPGGELHAFVELAGDFLEPGSVVVTMIDVDGDETVYRATQPSPYRFPVAVLVDGGTASAAELFAAALKAHGRACIVGESTYGKGVAAAVVATPDGAAVHGEVAAFRFPDGERVQGEGVRPDLPFPPREPSASLPAPLCAALARLASACGPYESEQLVAHRP